MCYKGKEKHEKRREERLLERDLWEEEKLELGASEGVRREKVRKLIMRERRCQKIMFPTATDEDNIYKRCNM